jgi:stage V sporulation protein K
MSNNKKNEKRKSTDNDNNQPKKNINIKKRKTLTEDEIRKEKEAEEAEKKEKEKEAEKAEKAEKEKEKKRLAEEAAEKKRLAEEAAEKEKLLEEEKRIKDEIEKNILNNFLNNDFFDDDSNEDTDEDSNKDMDEDSNKTKDDTKKILFYYFDPLEDKNNIPNKKNNLPKKKTIIEDDNDDISNDMSNNKLSDIFTILMNKNAGKSGVNNKKPEKKVEDFFDYFNEDTILHPINKEIKTINDLIELGLTYDPFDTKRYVINLRALNKCVEPLRDLNKMIGMKNVKEMIIDLMFFRLQNLRDGDNEMWHLVIQGTPGSGKTEIAKILGKLYYSLGIAKKDSFTPVKRSDLIGKFLGHTAKMTQEVFDNAKGGILFIDEAYSLGNPDGKDSFSKECIDTINQNLTENKDVIVFIAGYKEQLDESFFSYNPGLNRRFKMRITVDKYSANELREIYIKKIMDDKWEIMDNDLIKNIPLNFFEKNYEMFKYNGGDMENLWHLTKICHARRIFGKEIIYMKKIIDKDLEKAFNNYLNNDEFKNRKDDIKKYLQNTLYS